MKKLLITISLFFISTAPVFAQAIHCPDSGMGFTFSGPKLKTDIYGRSKAICRYYDRRHHKGTLEVYFYQDFDRQKVCTQRIYREAHARSREYQAYGFWTDGNKMDGYKQDFWLDLLDDLIEEAEKWALPCELNRRMYRRPIDPRNIQSN